MKRNILVGLIVNLFVLAGVANAQTYRGGMPWSKQSQYSSLQDQKAPRVTVQRPDYEKCKIEDSSAIYSYRVGIGSALDLDINNSGVISYLPDGAFVWKLSIEIPDAISNDLVFDKFNLPEGVALYLSNENGKQVEGAFTYLDNADNYSTASIQGDVVNLELDVPSGVKPADIQLHVSKIIGGYRGGLAQAPNAKYGNDVTGAVVPMINNEDFSDACEINAICPPDGQTYANLKQTVGHIYYIIGLGAYSCTGNLINNTAHDCRLLFITASHCESSGAMFDSTTTTFNSWKFYFNYEYPNCTGNVEGSANVSQYLTGAKFLSRSTHDPIVDGELLTLIGDFLLLELKDPLNKLGNDYNAYLGGWDRTATSPSGTKFIDFSHPQGDPKKQTVFTFIQSNGNFNSSTPSTHWSAKMEQGGIEEGSSGSGLFAESTGRMLGPLSGGPSIYTACDTTNGHRSLFSKIGRDWDYPEGEDGAYSRLKDYLDPAGTDAMSMPTVKISSTDDATHPTDCSSTDSPSSAVGSINELDKGIDVYPNPSHGTVYLQVHLEQSNTLAISVIDITGRKCAGYQSDNKINNTTLKLDLSSLPAGMYLLKIASEKATTTKKVIIQ